MIENYFRARVLRFEDLISCIEVVPLSRSEFDFFKNLLNLKSGLHLGVWTSFS